MVWLSNRCFSVSVWFSVYCMSRENKECDHCSCWLARLRKPRSARNGFAKNPSSDDTEQIYEFELGCVIILIDRWTQLYEWWKAKMNCVGTCFYKLRVNLFISCSCSLNSLLDFRSVVYGWIFYYYFLNKCTVHTESCNHMCTHSHLHILTI